MFKAKVDTEQLAAYFVVFHASVFGTDALKNIAALCDFHFRDEKTFTEAFWEWFVFGLYCVGLGVNSHCDFALRKTILDGFHAQIYSALENAGATAHRRFAVEQTLIEYEGHGSQSSVARLAVQKIFDRPRGVLSADSMQARELRVAIHESFKATLKEADRLFAQFTV